MSVPERRVEVVEIRSYLRETIAKIDEVTKYLAAEREDFAMRLAALEAAEDPAVLEVATDFEARSEAGRSYEGAEDAETLLSDAHRRFGPST